MDKLHPIATATIARIYLNQGMLAEAEEMYRGLLRRDPRNAKLCKGLAEVRERIQAERGPDRPDLVQLQAQESGFRCQWSVSDEGLESARLVLEQRSSGPANPGAKTGGLTLRLMSFPDSPRRPPLDIQIEQREGSLSLRPPREATMLSAAVGLLCRDRDEELFVSIVHSEAIVL